MTYALLLVQDPDEKEILRVVLQRAGLTVTIASDLERAMDSWAQRPADLVLCALEGLDPVEGIRRIRAETDAPVLIVLEPLQESVHCRVLDQGTDLVISRPFSPRLLIARVRALMRRAGGVQMFSLPNLRMAGLTLDPSTRTVEVTGQPRKHLTHLEFRLMYTLMIHRGQVLTPDIIVERVWGYSGKGDKELVRGLIRRLRTKVEPDPSSPRYVVTEPRVGYMFVEE
jgi:DNA-binding response OmpR family regulator